MVEQAIISIVVKNCVDIERVAIISIVTFIMFNLLAATEKLHPSMKHRGTLTHYISKGI